MLYFGAAFFTMAGLAVSTWAGFDMEDGVRVVLFVILPLIFIMVLFANYRTRRK
jgi:hypothetical protein